MRESDALRVIDDHLDGQDEFPPEVTAELTEWLRDDPDNADRAFQRVMLHVLLSRKLSQPDPPRLGGNGSDIVFIQTPAEPPPSPRWMLLLGIVVLIAAAVSGITTSLVLLLPQQRDQAIDIPKNHEGLPKPRVVGPEHRTSAGVHWATEAPDPLYSSWALNEKKSLTTGIAEYRIGPSSRFVVTGPARFAKLGQAEFSLLEGGCGVAWGDGADAQSWKMRTSNATLFVDQSTRFVLHTSSETGTVLSVLDGEVEFQHRPPRESGSNQSLLAGQAVWIEGGRVIAVESDWVNRQLGRVQSALNASYPQPLDAPLLYEGFDYPETLPTSSKFTHAGISLEHGGWGWEACWQESGSLGSSVDHAPLRRSTSQDRRDIEGLSFRDPRGYLLRTSGGQLRTSFGSKSRSERKIDLEAWPEETRDSHGIGADGSIVWLSFLAQSYGSAGGTRYAFLRIGNEHTGLRLGRLPGPDTSLWSVEVDQNNGDFDGPYASTIPADEAVFYVVRIQFQPGREQVHGWLNPELSTIPADSQAAFNFTTPEFRLRSVLIEGRYSTDFDELRLGPTFASVSPYHSE